MVNRASSYFPKGGHSATQTEIKIMWKSLLTSSCILLNERSFLHYFHSAISNRLSVRPKCVVLFMSLVVRKPAFCICENKDADYLHSECEADQGLCFRYMGSTIPLLCKSEFSSP